MDRKTVFDRSLNQATAVIDAMQPDDFDNTTPAAEWKVRRLAEHMLYELRWVADIVQGKTIAEAESKYDDVTDADFATEWQAAADVARQAVAAAALQAPVRISFEHVTVDEYLQQISFGLLIHAWDLARGIGVTVQLDEVAAQAAYDYATQHVFEWQQAGLPAGAPVPDTADIQTRLLAMSGRTSASSVQA